MPEESVQVGFVVGAEFYAEMIDAYARVPRVFESEQVRLNVDREFAPAAVEIALTFAEFCEKWGPLARDHVRELLDVFPGADAEMPTRTGGGV